MTSQEHLEKKFDIFEACYAYSMENHTGQFSRAYRLGCSIGRKDFTAGLSLQRNGYESLTDAGKDFYNHLLNRDY
jgi:hypothetical protein